LDTRETQPSPLAAALIVSSAWCVLTKSVAPPALHPAEVHGAVGSTGEAGVHFDRGFGAFIRVASFIVAAGAGFLEPS
jgi:hypothetical protein